jgi:hypothetical protein
VIAGKHVCLRVGKRCKKRYESTYRKHGLTCRKGRLRKVAPPPDDSGDTELPPPQPAPPVPGHYTGQTSQGHLFEFDVLNGTTASLFHFAQIDETCPSYSFSWETTISTQLPIANGILNIHGSGRVQNSDGSFLFITNTLYGRFDGGTAQGDFTFTTHTNQARTDPACVTGTVSWNAIRSG